MKTKRIILASLLYFVLLTTVEASASPSGDILGRFDIKPTKEEKARQYADALREQAVTDSLLNSIKIDSLTGSVYQMFPPLLYSPGIIGGLEGSRSHTLKLPPVSYTEMAGVIYLNADGQAKTIYPTVVSGNIADPIPEWFRKSLRLQNQIHDAEYKMMIKDPSTVKYADWTLPYPPRLPEEDNSFRAYFTRLYVPEVAEVEPVAPELEQKRRNWLHTFNVGLQVSQAYVSSNWYQGGNSYLAGLFNFNWNVELNTVYHPNLLFQSNLQYKLAVNSNPKGSLHKYNTSQDLFQYTLKTGLKAFNHWFYSLNLLFNTQFFNAYPDDSEQRTSALLSPGTLNIGLGMTYTLEKKGAKLSATVSPLAYNLKTCIASDIDHLQFNIKQNRKTVSEIGSSAEINLTWNFNSNISWKSRLFLFTDYSYFLADWENTFNFQLNKFLSTQIYLHPRFDSSSENLSKWHHWMLHEILSFGISYTFATPK